MDKFRPLEWDSYIGQDRLKDTLKIAINGSCSRNERLDHILLVGPPGSGKTSLAALIAEESFNEMIDLIAPIKPSILRRVVEAHDGILFIDEIHRMSPKDQESLLPLLEDQRYQLDNGLFLENDDLVIVGATTEPKKIIKPLWDRFLLKPPFDEYSDSEMAQIIIGMANILHLTFDEDQAKILGRATGGIPRAAKQFVRMAQDLNSESAMDILDRCMITPDGLTLDHMNYLEVLIKMGGQAGLSMISTHLGLSTELVMDIERLLVKRNMIQFSKSGRMALKLAYTTVKQRRF